MKIILYVILNIILLCSLAPAQEIIFPHPLSPGTSFTAPVGPDTLYWVLKDGQYETAKSKAKQLIVADSMISILKVKNLKLNELITLKDSTITDLQSGYDRYKNKWLECDQRVEDLEITVVRQRRAIFLFSVLGLAIGGLGGALLF